MRMLVRSAVVALAVLGFSTIAQAEVKLTVSNMHICCEACTKGIEKALAGMEGVQVQVDQDAKTTTITAPTVAAAQAALDALAAAGFHGESDRPELKMKDDSGVSGTTRKLELSGAHNCCGSCARAITAAIETVPGAKAEIKPKVKTFVVEGDFDAAALVKALNAAGFHVKKAS